jgi:nicotinate-nucleotide adenylyltransferase
MKIGLYFGTFNPIHIGHLIIANHLVENADIDAVWFVVTPLNPLKDKKTLLADHHRLAMVQLAVEDYPKLDVSDIEFKLPQPNYTVHTLAYLGEKFPQHQFALIMGSDNIQSFHKWKNFEFILENYPIWVYPRLTEIKTQTDFETHPNVQIIQAPIIEISATAIRNDIKAKKNIRPLLPEKVWHYIDAMNFYKK